MQKRDKFGRFLKKTVTKKSARKVKKKVYVEKANKDACDNSENTERRGKNRVVVKLEKTRIKGSPLPISLFDLQDMIQAEVAFQIRDRW